jgi:glycyl-tRNA synthetase
VARHGDRTRRYLRSAGGTVFLRDDRIGLYDHHAPPSLEVLGPLRLFHDYMVDCRESKRRYRHDQVRGRWVEAKGERIFVTTMAEADHEQEDVQARALKYFRLRAKDADELAWDGPVLDAAGSGRLGSRPGPGRQDVGNLTEPREFNLMFKTYVGALSGEEGAAFLRPETAQGIFVNFKNVLDSSRVRVPFGIAQIGKSFRNEITPRNFTFRSREFEQMEIEFFCHPAIFAGVVPVLARSADAVVRRSGTGRRPSAIARA